ncbi:helicase domain protein [Acidothermus cellulolyticus 11B]|uniref:Helicase domain protein n=1 Tax=Acidothermus cellulolyticus (strain ATCC 43068 / DSM 8971 / 11B) TaxID=351607 RepID=A0LWC8_ACIC1|nr:helicase-related protein [Acidothermus cellulolyticus]ABK53738.1 helicase domain protein [Acidothermus cellulolyticus 11B]
MTPEQTRDAIIDALRRDLVGPLVDKSGIYPGATAKRIERGYSMVGRLGRDRLFVADDGEEILLASPTSRYIIGVLYPMELDLSEEHILDAEQAPVRPDEADEDLDTDPGNSIPEPFATRGGESGHGMAEDDVVLENLPRDRPGRPSSLGVSFVIRDTTPLLTLRVTGARYEPFPYTTANGQPGTAWHRVPIDRTVPFSLQVEQPEFWGKTLIDVDPLNLEIGVRARKSSDGKRVVTCYLANRTPRNGAALAERVLFASQLAVAVPEGLLCDYPERDSDTTAEAASLRLLYRDSPIRAVGHGVDAVVHRVKGEDIVRTEALPVAAVSGTTPDIEDEDGPLAVDMDGLGRWEVSAVATVERLIRSYRDWITSIEEQAARLTGTAGATAQKHVQVCRSFADAIEEGWETVKTNSIARQCLEWASVAMAQQRRSYAAATRHVTLVGDQVQVDGAEPTTGPAKWRPFQLAFLLANLCPVINPRHPRRGVVDVIWMPTGGGKTEAYLGLAAFAMLYRRRAQSNAGGTTVLMRYTLRLLTAQQLQRAASLICALETLRLKNRELLGNDRFSIGVWLGQASTPNRREDALKALEQTVKDAKARRDARPFLLSRCPACATEIGRVVEGRVLGYDVQHLENSYRVRASCENPVCAFHLARSGGRGLPVYEVDEDIYKKPPAFLIATVDKFAQLAWKEDARVIFGIDRQGRRVRPSPTLIIQDELHLISGPLGSLVALYESALHALCCHDKGESPHVVAATATTRAYARQAEALYNCPADQVRLVPPPGLSIDDRFFTRRDDRIPPRKFVGVCATGVNSFPRTQMRVIASLAHAAAAIEQCGASVDPYWTNLVFFGSLRDLGHAKALLATDLRGYAWRLVSATGVRTGPVKKGKQRLAIRTLEDIELTSASSNAASEALERLARRRWERGTVDLALATSVIEVGLDIDRLGLLTIVRQPKTSAQYIQVAGRVGRDPTNAPGLVVVLLNPLTGRDMSHYERFTSVHERLYGSVEPASVTPFTDAALARGLRSTIAAVVRQIRSTDFKDVVEADVPLVEAAAAAIRDRAGALVGKAVGERIEALTRAAVTELRAAINEKMPWGTAGRHGAQFLRALEDPAPPDKASWAVLTSLRNVDAYAAVSIDEDWLPPDPCARRSVMHRQDSATDVDEEDAW